MLRLSDLDGRVLSIERNLSLEVLGPTKTTRNRRLTLGVHLLGRWPSSHRTPHSDVVQLPTLDPRAVQASCRVAGT